MNGKINIDYLFKAAFEDFEMQPSSEMLDNIFGDAFDTSVQSSFEDFTLAPSTHVWENINDAIPTEADKLLSTSFDEFAVTPPTHLWENISMSIPDETDKLLSTSFNEFAVTPPIHLWENISESIPSEVEQILASSFDEFAVTPPDGMWASIQGELDVEEHFDAKFQEAFLGFEPKPSEHILNNLLSNKFDTGVRRAFMRHEVSPQEAVWDRIKPYIRFGPTIQRHVPTLRRVAAVLLCLFMFAFLYNRLDISIGDIANSGETNTNNSTPQIPTPTVNEAEQPIESVFENTATERTVSVEQQPANRERVEESAELIPQFISQSSLLGSENSRFNVGGSSLPSVSVKKDKAVLVSPPKFTVATPTENERIDGGLISSISNVKVLELESYTPNIIASNPDLSNFDALEVTTAAKGYGNEYIVKSNLMDMGEDSDLAKMMLSYKGLYISSSFAGFYSRIHNDAVRESLSDPDQYLMDYVVDGGVSLGIGAGYQFTPNFGIEAEVMRSTLSQSYRELTALNISNTSSARTTYLYVPLSFKYQLSRSNSMNRRVPRTFSTVLGMHYGKLQNTQFTSNREIEPNTENDFIQQELGVFTGIDWHFYVSPNMHVTLGGRLAAGTDFEYLSTPFAAGTPYNIQSGVRVGLNYRFATRRYKWARGIH